MSADKLKLSVANLERALDRLAEALNEPSDNAHVVPAMRQTLVVLQGRAGRA